MTSHGASAAVSSGSGHSSVNSDTLESGDGALVHDFLLESGLVDPTPEEIAEVLRDGNGTVRGRNFC